MKLIKKIISKLDNKKIELIIMAVILILVLVINFLTPIIADDFHYAMRKGKHISSLSDVFKFQLWHYFNWGGRTIAHGIAQIFLIMPKSVFNICNSLMNVAEVYLIYKVAQGNKKSNPFMLVVTYLLLWFFLPVYGSSNMWLIGSCNYLWTIVFILLFIYQSQKTKRENLINIILMFLLGILAGWTNENTAFGCIVTVIGLIIVQKQSKEKIKKWQIFGLIGNIVGFAILILAPGNYVRLNGTPDDRMFIVKIISRFLAYTEKIVVFLLPLIIILTILISIYIYKKKKIDKRIYPFIAGSIFSIYSMLLSPQFPERAWTGIVVLLIVPIIILLYDIKKTSRLTYIAMIDIVIIGLFIFVQGYSYLAKDTNKLRATWAQRNKEIEYAKSKGKDTIDFERYYAIDKRNPAYNMADIEKDPKHWSNRDVASYYGLKEVRQKETKIEE